MTTTGHLFARLQPSCADPELARHITICCWPEPYGPDPIVFGPQAPARTPPEILPTRQQQATPSASEGDRTA